MKKESLKKYIAEAIGTFVLVLFGCGVAVATGADLVATSLTFGLVIVAMVYSIGNISGCHINPAVSLAMLITKKLNGKDFGFYVLFQAIGSFLATLMLLLFFGIDCGFGANSVQALAANVPLNELLFGLLAEIILTFVFIITILGVTSRSSNKAVVGIVIGLTLVLVHLLGINLTGTSVNPIRSLFPALFAGGTALDQLWVFLVGPFIGSALAAFTYTFFLDKGNEENKA